MTGTAHFAGALFWIVDPFLVQPEIFGWMARNPDNIVSQALSKPGHELQHRLSTAEPTAEQLEVAEAALAACLALEHGAR